MLQTSTSDEIPNSFQHICVKLRKLQEIDGQFSVQPLKI